MRKVGEEWDVEPAEAALLARRVHPRQVREVRVHRACDHLRGHSQMTSDERGREGVAQILTQ